MANKRILLVGENAEDIWVEGRCDRLSEEAPIPIQIPTKVHKNPGMAANVKANLLTLGSTPVDFFHQTKGIFKIRHVEEVSGHHLLRVDDGEDSFEPDFSTQVINGMDKAGYSAIVISDYCKGLLSKEFISSLAAIAREIGAVTWMDTRKILGDWSRDIDFVKINNKEFDAHIRAGVTDPWNWCKNLIVTRGKDGARLYAQDGSIAYSSPSRASKIFSVCGAGDTSLAALVTRFSETRNIHESIDFAMKAAAIAVAEPGVVAVRREQVDQV